MAFKSGIERNLDQQLRLSGLEYSYEQIKIPYTTSWNYIPDFYIPSRDIYIEAKGWLRREDQVKMRAVKRQHPELDIRFVFEDITKKIQNSKTTNAEWADRNGFPYAEGTIPLEWFDASDPD